MAQNISKGWIFEWTKKKIIIKIINFLWKMTFNSKMTKVWEKKIRILIKKTQGKKMSNRKIEWNKERKNKGYRNHNNINTNNNNKNENLNKNRQHKRRRYETFSKETGVFVKGCIYSNCMFSLLKENILSFLVSRANINIDAVWLGDAMNATFDINLLLLTVWEIHSKFVTWGIWEYYVLKVLSSLVIQQ